MPAQPPAILTDLRARAPYSEGAGIYRIVPQGVATPADVAELQELVEWAAGSGTPLVPRGAGSGMPGGNVGPGVIVDLKAFGDLEIDAARRIARVGAATTAAAINAAARSYGLRLPPDPSSSPFATSGGMVSTNAAGPRTVRYGSVRRWVNALEVVGATEGATRTIRRAVVRGSSNGGTPMPPVARISRRRARTPPAMPWTSTHGQETSWTS